MPCSYAIADSGVSREFKEQKVCGESKSIHFQVVHPQSTQKWSKIKNHSGKTLKIEKIDYFSNIGEFLIAK